MSDFLFADDKLLIHNRTMYSPDDQYKAVYTFNPYTDYGYLIIPEFLSFDLFMRLSRGLKLDNLIPATRTCDLCFYLIRADYTLVRVVVSVHGAGYTVVYRHFPLDMGLRFGSAINFAMGRSITALTNLDIPISEIPQFLSGIHGMDNQHIVVDIDQVVTNLKNKDLGLKQLPKVPMCRLTSNTKKSNIAI